MYGGCLLLNNVNTISYREFALLNVHQSKRCGVLTTRPERVTRSDEEFSVFRCPSWVEAGVCVLVGLGSSSRWTPWLGNGNLIAGVWFTGRPDRGVP